MNFIFQNTYRLILVLVTNISVISSCSEGSGRNGDEPQEAPISNVVDQHKVDSSAVSIAVISLDPQGWNDLRAFIQDLPTPTVVKIFYGDGNVLAGNNATAMHLLDSLSGTRSLKHTDVPATLPYFSTALSSAIAASLQTDCKHTRTVILGTFPPLLLKTRAEFQRIGPIITRTELESLAQLHDHRFIIIGPSESSVLRDMLFRALTESKSNVTNIGYQSGALH